MASSRSEVQFSGTTTPSVQAYSNVKAPHKNRYGVWLHWCGLARCTRHKLSALKNGQSPFAAFITRNAIGRIGYVCVIDKTDAGEVGITTHVGAGSARRRLG